MTELVPDIPILNAFFFVVGLVVIIRGSDFFLDAAVWIARASGVSQVIIGATIVSFCTTAPELVSSVTAVLKDSPDMALGNAVGSVICNTGLILGVMLIFVTAEIQRHVFMFKGCFMLGVLLAAVLMTAPFSLGAGNVVTRLEGIILLGGLCAYLVVNYYEARQYKSVLPEIILDSEQEAGEGEAPEADAWLKHAGLFLLGAGLVALGAYLLVAFGQRLARNLGVSEAIISLVFVAFGTSLPELFTAVSAVRKKAHDVSVGNIFGANVMNIALVTGVSATIRPLSVKDAYMPIFDIPAALVLCSAVFFIGLWRSRTGRRTGILLLVLYLAYLGSLFAMGRL